MISPLNLRVAIGRFLSRRLLPNSFSIISDDCWGGEIYRQLWLKYQTPTVGLLVRPGGYLDFIESVLTKNLEKLEFIDSKCEYPVATYLGSIIEFMHYKTQREAEDKFARRFQRIDKDKILVKVDFGKLGYTKADIERWNEWKLPNSIAFYAATTEIPSNGVFNGVLVPDWDLDGVVMFGITQKYFDFYKWVNKEKVSNSILYRALNVLFFNPPIPEKYKPGRDI